MGDVGNSFRNLLHGTFEDQMDDDDEDAIQRWLAEGGAGSDAATDGGVAVETNDSVSGGELPTDQTRRSRPRR